MKATLSYILLLISVISVHGQVDLRVIPDKRDLVANQQLKLTVILEIKGDENAQQSKIMLPDLSKFDMIGTASDQNTLLEPKTKTVVNQIVYLIVLQPKQTGKIKIGSALVTVNDKIYKTEPFDVFVTESPKKAVAKTDIENDLYLNLEVKDRNIYKNQPTIAVLKAYSKNFNNFRNVSDISFPKNSGVKFHAINFKKSDIEQNENSKMSSQVIGVFLISTQESGDIDVPSVSAKIKNNTSTSIIKSNKILLKVKQLPAGAPVNFKNAIGTFKIDLNASKTKDNIIGEALDVNLIISGDGNFRAMDLPKLSESADYSFFQPKVVYNTQNSENGSSGNVVLKYVVIPKTSGKIVLKTEDFSFFDPSTTTYENLKADTLSIVSMTQQQLSDTKTTLDKVNEYTSSVIANVNPPKIIADKLKLHDSYEINYKIIVGNLVLLCGLVFFIFSYRKKKLKKKKKKKIRTVAKIENIHEAEERLKKENIFDFEAELIYLEGLKNSKDYKGFFKAYENFQQELEIFSERNCNLRFKNYLLQNKGAKVAEDFRNMNQEISIEKFAPVTSEENVENIFEKIRNLISEINK